MCGSGACGPYAQPAWGGFAHGRNVMRNTRGSRQVSKSCSMESNGAAVTVLAFAGLILSSMNAIGTMCICGHLKPHSIPGSLVGALMVWWAFSAMRHVNIAVRIIVALTCVATTLILLKSIGDPLWWGAGALLR